MVIGSGCNKELMVRGRVSFGDPVSFSFRSGLGLVPALGVGSGLYIRTGRDIGRHG